MQSLCSSQVLLDMVGRIAHTDHVKHYWISCGVGIATYYNDLFFGKGEQR